MNDEGENYGYADLTTSHDPDDTSPPGPSSIPSQQVDDSPVVAPIDGVLPAHCAHVLSGSLLGGRTSFLARLLADLSRESHIWGRTVGRPPFIGYVSAARTTRELIPTFEQAGWAAPATYSLVDDPAVDIDRHLSRLITGRLDRLPHTTPAFTRAAEYFRRRYFPTRSPLAPLPPDSLIAIDGIDLAFGIEPLGNITRQISAPLLLLQRFCRANRLTLLLLHYTTKHLAGKAQRYIRAADRSFGSVSMLAGAGTQMVLEEPVVTGRSDGLYTLTVIPRGTRLKTFAVLYDRDALGRFIEVGHGAVASGESLPEEPRSGLQAEENAQVLLQALWTLPAAQTAEGALTAQVGMACGLPRKQLQRALDLLETRSQIRCWGQTKGRRVQLVLPV